MKEQRKLGARHTQPQVTLKAFVATPAYDGKVDTDYAISLAESSMMAANHGIGVHAGVMGNGAFIELARNTFVKLFLESDCTHLFFIDADLRWEARAFLGLMMAGRPVCAGLYRRRQEPEEYPVRYVEKDGCLEIKDGGWIECDRVPTGFLCIERKVVEEMAKDARKLTIKGVGEVPELFYTQVRDVGDGKFGFMGEDFCWCDDYCKRYSTSIGVWPDFDFTHGGYKCNWHEFINRTVEEAEAAELAKEQAAA